MEIDWLHMVLIIIVFILASLVIFRMKEESNTVRRIAALTSTEFEYVRRIFHGYRFKLSSLDNINEGCLQKLVDDDWLVQLKDDAFVAGTKGEYCQRRVMSNSRLASADDINQKRSNLKVVPINDDGK